MMKLSPLWLMALIVMGLAGCDQSPAVGMKSSESPIEDPDSPEIVPAEVGFKVLKLAQFVPYHGESGTWTEKNDIIVCSGVPKGYLASKEIYRNFTLRVDYEFVLTEEQQEDSTKANTGFLLTIQDPNKVWPVSLEVQGRFDMMGSINGNGGIPALKVEDHPNVRERVRLPADHWNAIEITCVEGAITSRLNGEIVCTSEATSLKEGRIGLQSEGYVVRFRNLRIRCDPPGPHTVTQ